MGAKGATIPTTRTRSRTWTLTSGWATRGSELRLTTWRPPSSCTPGFSIKRIFPEYWPAGPGTHRTLLQYPHGPVPELCLALPWRTAARGTRLRSHVPISPLGLDKTNFPRVLAPMGAKGETIPTTRTRSRTWTLTSGWATRGSELRLTTWRPPSSCTPGFSIKRIFPEYWPAGPGTHRTLLQYPHGPVPELCRGVPLLGAPGSGLMCPFPPWVSIKRIFPGYWPPWGQRGKQYPQPALVPVPELWRRGGLPGGQNYV